jgi:hypothetical protein
LSKRGLRATSIWPQAKLVSRAGSRPVSEPTKLKKENQGYHPPVKLYLAG